jgi:hypothetical protein
VAVESNRNAYFIIGIDNIVHQTKLSGLRIIKLYPRTWRIMFLGKWLGTIHGREGAESFFSPEADNGNTPRNIVAVADDSMKRRINIKPTRKGTPITP